MENMTQAMESYRQALSLDSGNVAALEGLARLSLRMGDEEVARELFRRLAEVENTP
jgi:cytochrome c-type biogenesis protein CcmH/NrfG